MNEHQAILNAIAATDDPLYLATVVDVVGSSYRRPTARMLILPDGQHVGTISGGCLERDVCRAAAELSKRGPRLISFDTRQGATDFNPRYNTGCHGIIYILVERVTRDAACPAAVLRTVGDTGIATVCATIYQTDIPRQVAIGARFTAPGKLLAGVKGSSQREPLDALWHSVASSGRPICCEFETEDGNSRAMLERVAPPRSLWIFGAGDDAMPLRGMAEQLGWQTSVIDPRAGLLTADRFPSANRVCRPWGSVADVLSVPDDSAAVLMTHDFAADKTLIPWLLESGISYVGVLGPKSRTARVMNELHAAGRLPSLDSLDRLHTPVGLDLGASTPAEIAVAVLGEIIAESHERSGGRLKSRAAPIHDPVRHALIDARANSDARQVTAAATPAEAADARTA